MEAPLSDIEPIRLRPRAANQAAAKGQGDSQGSGQSARARPQVVFNRQELDAILGLYGRQVAAGEWRDYALDMGSDKAVFSIFRKSSECPIYRIEKNPKLAKKQGAYSVIAATGLILKRGQDLKRVISVLEKPVRLVDH
ncbi:MAG: hypothetical protein RLZ98_1262 [Pseudomonadota bacterium]|jgi:hypothetical protein